MPDPIVKADPGAMLPPERITTAISAMAASARAVMAPMRSKQEIIEECEEAARELAMEDPDSARYSIKMGGRTVMGIAAPLAQEVSRINGNNFTAATLESQTEDHWVIQGVIVDMRTGYMLARPYIQRKCPPGGSFKGDYWESNKGAKIEKDRALSNAFGTGVSKAIRNAVAAAFPNACRRALGAANETIDGKRGLPSKSSQPEQDTQRITDADWDALLERAASLGVTQAQCTAYLKKNKKEWNQRDFYNLTDCIGAIEAGEASVGQAFGGGKQGEGELPFGG